MTDLIIAGLSPAGAGRDGGHGRPGRAPGGRRSATGAGVARRRGCMALSGPGAAIARGRPGRDGARYRRRRAADHRRPMAWPALAALSGRRDDAGGFRFLLGPIGLAWTMLLGSAFSLAYRVWVQRRRGRRIRKGLVPLGPGMTAGGGRGVPVREFRALPSLPANRRPMCAGRHGNGGRGNGFALAGHRARRGPAPGDGTGSGGRGTARINRHTGTGVRATRSRFLPARRSVACPPCQVSRRRSRSARRGSPAGPRSCPMRRRSASPGGALLPACSTASRC